MTLRDRWASDRLEIVGDELEEMTLIMRPIAQMWDVEPRQAPSSVVPPMEDELIDF